MKKLDDHTYRQSLKTVNQAFDSEQLWNNIEDKLDKKPRRRFLFFILFGTILGIFALTLVWQIPPSNNSEEASTDLRKIANADKTQATPKTGVNKELIIPKHIKEPTTNAVQEIPKPQTTVYAKQTQTSTSETTTSKINASYSKPKRQIQAKSRVPFIGQKAQEFAREGFTTPKLFPSTPKHIYPVEKTSLKKLRQINEYLIAPDSNEKRISKQQSLQLTISAGSSKSNYKGLTNLGSTLAAQRSEANKDLFNAQLNLAYGFDVAKNLSIITGVNFSRMTERFNGAVESITSETIKTDTAIFIKTIEGINQYYSGEQTKLTKTTTTVQHYNHYYALGVSLGARYTRVLKDKYGLFAEASFNYNPIHLGRGRTFALNGGFESLDAISSKQLLQASTVLGLQYQVTEQISYQLGLQWQKDLTSRISSVHARLSKQAFSINAGLIFYLK